MICPKCGRPVPEAAVICPGCDFILDTDFLGEEILDEEKKLRPGRGGVDPGSFNLADAVILGDIDDTAQSFETSDSGFHVKETTGARLYVSGRSQALLAPDAIPAVLDDAMGSVRLTPFEKHVLTFIDGERPVEAIRRVAGLDDAEVKTALATLADKGVVRVIGRALVDLGMAGPAPIRRRQERRRIRNTIAGAMGSVSDETDRAIEEAFRTQTGLSPIRPEDLPDSGDSDEGDVFSSSLEGAPAEDGFEKERPTNELLSLASSAAPAAAPADAPGQDGEGPSIKVPSSTGSFVPVSQTADPPPAFSGSDGFDDFGSGTKRVELSNLSSSDAGTSEAGAQLSVGASFARPGSEEEISVAFPGSEAIARLANSQLAGQAFEEPVGGGGPTPLTPDDDEEDEGQQTQARAQPFGVSLSRLLSDAEAPPDDDDDGPFASLVGAPEPDRVPPPPVDGVARNSSIASAEEYFDDFSGEEYSDEGSGDEGSGDEGSGDDLTPIAPAQGRPGEAPDFTDDTPQMTPAVPRGTGGTRDSEALAELSDLSLPSDLGSSLDALPAPEAASQVDDALDELSLSGLGEASAPLPPPGSPSEISDAKVSPPPALSEEKPALDDRPSSEASSEASEAILEASELSLGELPPPGPPGAPRGKDTQVVDLSEEPALSELVGGFDDDSSIGSKDASSVFKRDSVVGAAPPVVAAPPPAADPQPEPNTGEVSKVFTRDPAPSVLASEEDDDDEDDSDEHTNLLEDPRLAFGFRGSSGAVPLGTPPGRVGPIDSEENTALRETGPAVAAVVGAGPPPDAAAAPGETGAAADLGLESELQEADDDAGSSGFDSSEAPTGTVPAPGGRATPDEDDEPSWDEDDDEGNGEIIERRPATDGSVEYISESQFVRPVGAAAPAQEGVNPSAPTAGFVPPEDSIVEDSLLSELPPDDPAYAAEGEASRPALPSGGTVDSLLSELESSEEASAVGSSGAHAVDHALPASLIDDSALESEVQERHLRSQAGPEDPNATAYVRAPTGLVSADSGGESSWAEGTHEYDEGAGRARDESTGEEEERSVQRVGISTSGAAAHISSTGVGQPVEDRRDEGLGSAELVDKARRLFRDALRDWKGGRESRAKMNAKLASIYDPHNEEYRAALEQWEGQNRRPATNGKAREVLLYEEAQRLEAEDEFEGAITLLKQGIELNPRIAAFHNRLGVILALRKQDYDQAADYVKRAIELEPDNMHYRSNYGKIVQKARMKGQVRA